MPQRLGPGFSTPSQKEGIPVVSSDRKIVLGIDEVGRGPWAGPLVIGAVILGPDFENLEAYSELNDSKKLSKAKREELNKIILEHALATGLGWVSAEEIDRFGLSRSLRLATRRAVKQILSQKIKFTEIVIDGTINFLDDTPLKDYVVLLPKADALVKEVSAASIIAKVARDDYMTKLGETYPGYGFERHVGYGTAAHKKALLEYGPCAEHRKSFRPIAELLAKSPKTTTPLAKPNQATASPSHATSSEPPTSTGRHAEDKIRQMLEKSGHAIIATNYKTKSYEIDIISIRDQKIYFTEVKYRKTSAAGSPLEAITEKKLSQMHFAATAFLASHPEFQNLDPILAAASVLGQDFKIEDWLELQ